WKHTEELKTRGFFEPSTYKGYDATANRKAARARGICPIIPYRRNARGKSIFFYKVLYKRRARIEKTTGKFKRFALRCEKTAETVSLNRRFHL
ncbi:MAG: hypothetical protein ABF705_10200, partial [Acetobacter syzygii]